MFWYKNRILCECVCVINADMLTLLNYLKITNKKWPSSNIIIFFRCNEMPSMLRLDQKWRES